MIKNYFSKSVSNLCGFPSISCLLPFLTQALHVLNLVVLPPKLTRTFFLCVLQFSGFFLFCFQVTLPLLLQYQHGAELISETFIHTF